MRNSKQRTLILDTLIKFPTHPTAEELYNKLKADNPKLSLGTVYRNLGLLYNTGVIRKIDGLDTNARYDHNTHAHYHFTCLSCGDIYDIPCQMAGDIIKKTEDSTGLKITQHNLVMRGLCSKCKEKTASKSKEK